MSPILGNIIAIALVAALVALCVHALRTTPTCAGCSGACSGSCEGGECRTNKNLTPEQKAQLKKFAAMRKAKSRMHR